MKETFMNKISDIYMLLSRCCNYCDTRCEDGQVKFVYLKATKQMILERLKLRAGHYFKANPDLVQSQFDTLEVKLLS